MSTKVKKVDVDWFNADDFVIIGFKTLNFVSYPFVAKINEAMEVDFYNIGTMYSNKIEATMYHYQNENGIWAVILGITDNKIKGYNYFNKYLIIDGTFAEDFYNKIEENIKKISVFDHQRIYVSELSKTIKPDMEKLLQDILEYVDENSLIYENNLNNKFDYTQNTEI